MIAVGVWYEVLYGVVPERRLNDCYLHAVRHRTNTFALAPTELCIAWSEIRLSEMHRHNPARQITHGFCEKCNNTGGQPVYNADNFIVAMKNCSHVFS